MGTRCAPPFANLFLAALEERALASWEGTTPSLWLRFLDDVLMLWTGGDRQLQDFLAHLNSQMHHINFTLQSSQESTTFMDLAVYKGHRFRKSGILDTKLHIKSTNPQTFLHFSSCHPPPTFATIIKGELLRALRSTSVVSQLLQKFLERGYPKQRFMKVADTLAFGQRQQLLTSQPKQQLLPNVTIFSATHHPALDSAAIWRILMDEETPFQPMVVRPRPTSHRDLLVRTKTPGRTATVDRPDPTQHLHGSGSPSTLHPPFNRTGCKD